MQEFKTEFKNVNSKQILVDSEYQRQVDYLRVRKMVANFNPNLVNPIKVSFRGNRYYCFDGQHTLAMLKSLNDGKDLPVPCKVYYGMHETDEAKLFSEQNGIARAVQSNQKLKSLYVAGDIDVIEFKKCVEDCGIQCDFTSSQARNKIICYSTVFKIYMKHGEKHLKTILKTIIASWNGDKESLSKEIILGMDLFIRTYKDEYINNLLVKRLSRVSPITIKRNGSATSIGGAKRFAVQIFDIYNRNTTTNRLDYKF